FVFLENDDILPFRLLESVDAPKLTLAVIEPTLLFPDYLDLVPVREWETIGLTDTAKRLAFVIAPIGETAKASTANLQSPILVNYETMTARQVILTDSGLSARHPLGYARWFPNYTYSSSGTTHWKKPIPSLTTCNRGLRSGGCSPCIGVTSISRTTCPAS